MPLELENSCSIWILWHHNNFICQSTNTTSLHTHKQILVLQEVTPTSLLQQTIITRSEKLRGNLGALFQDVYPQERGKYMCMYTHIPYFSSQERHISCKAWKLPLIILKKNNKRFSRWNLIYEAFLHASQQQKQAKKKSGKKKKRHENFKWKSRVRQKRIKSFEYLYICSGETECQ